MNINKIGSSQSYEPTVRKPTEEFMFEESMNLNKLNSGSVLDYYNSLCKEFPDISFRLDDENSIDKTPYHLGYNNSMNQRGSNFSNPRQCSIQIDVAVIRHMQADPKYADQIIGAIKNTKMDYDIFVRIGRSEGIHLILITQITNTNK